MIKLVQRKDIDDARWNSVIAASKHETIYPYTWYLDASADQWLGMIMNNYECIMPVAIKKKYNVKYFYQPFYNQQLGVYSEKAIDSEIARMFLLKLSENYKMGDYSFNAGNILGEEPGFEVHDRSNYILPLHNDYEELYTQYSSNCKTYLRKSYNSDLVFTDKISVDQLIDLKRESEKIKRDDAHYEQIGSMFRKLVEQEKANIYGVSSDNKICSAGLFAKSSKRVIYLFSASNSTGREYWGMFQVIDTIIQRHANMELILDFEGSDISTIARFFAGFGALPEIYQGIQYSSLPGFIQKIKKYV